MAGFGIASILPLMFYYGASAFNPPPEYSGHRTGSYRQDYKEFQQNLFFVAVPFGILSMIISSFILNNAISSGLIFGGIFSVSNGYINYWSELSDQTLNWTHTV